MRMLRALCEVNNFTPMAKQEKTALNLSLPADLVAVAKSHFAPLGKGALSKRIERELIAFLRKKGVRLPERHTLKGSV